MSEDETRTKFTYNDIVRIKNGAPSTLTPGTIGWIVGWSFESDRSGAYLQEFPSGTVYIVEYENGSDDEVPEEFLDFE